MPHRVQPSSHSTSQTGRELELELGCLQLILQDARQAVGQADRLVAALQARYGQPISPTADAPAPHVSAPEETEPQQSS